MSKATVSSLLKWSALHFGSTVIVFLAMVLVQSNLPSSWSRQIEPFLMWCLGILMFPLFLAERIFSWTDLGSLAILVLMTTSVLLWGTALLFIDRWSHHSWRTRASLLAGILLWGRLWIGVHQHNEFGDEYHVIIKHRPTWQWYFYSPVGMSDMRLEDLPPTARAEEEAYQEFIRP